VTDIFVFGSNLAGRHGAGAAKWAHIHRGAIYGQGVGRQGDSYAIPTKDGRNRADLKDPKQTLSLAAIKAEVRHFLHYARSNPHLTFEVTPIGCGLAGYKYSEIGPLFADAPPNVKLPAEFRPYAIERE
jgi:hypothetical protein